jgi:AcrR family transcriptional regulator
MIAPDSQREHILKAAMLVLAKRGRDAVTMRTVTKAAQVQPSVVSQLFNDKACLLNAVADYGFEAYLARKGPPTVIEDPVELLRASWRSHIHFGLTNRKLYLLIYAESHVKSDHSAAERSHRILRTQMQRVASAGRLRVGEERAAYLFHAAACGIVMTLLSMKDNKRDLTLSEAACDAALAAIVLDQPILLTPTIKL